MARFKNINVKKVFLSERFSKPGTRPILDVHYEMIDTKNPCPDYRNLSYNKSAVYDGRFFLDDDAIYTRVPLCDELQEKLSRALAEYIKTYGLI